MNYQKLYNTIVDNRLLNKYNGYTEKHHIIPRSLGGKDDEANLVSLSAREHFICHYLLAKMYPEGSFEWYKTNHAFMMMKCESLVQERYFNSRLYESLKYHHSSLMSIAQTGKNNSQYGSMWICNVELKENKKIGKNEDIPEGCVKGRNKWNEIKRKSDKKAERKSFTQNKLDKKINYYNSLLLEFKQGDFKSIREFCRSKGDDIVFETVLRNWRRYFPEEFSSSSEGYSFSSSDVYPLSDTQ